MASANEPASRRSFLGGAFGSGLVATSGSTISSPLPPPYAYEKGDLGGWIPDAPASYTLRNLTLLDGDGRRRAGGVRVENGVIAEVGALSSGTDAGGATLFPGFFDGGTPIGLWEVDLEGSTHDESESSDSIVPAVNVLDSFNALSAVIPVGRRQGVLGALCIPSGGLVSGQAAWVHLAGSRTSEATMAKGAGLLINLGRGGTGALPNQPRSRMGVVAKLRELFEANKLPDDPHAGCSADEKAHKCTGGQCKKGKAAAKKGEKPPEFTPTQRVWHAALRREQKVIFSANRSSDILAGLALAKEFSLDAVFLGGAEAHLVARDLADANVPLIVGPITTQPSGWDTLHTAYENAARLHAAGVNLVLRTGSPHNLRELPTEAVVAVAHGLPYEAAIAAACGRNAAKIWGIPVGSIAVGQRATFALANGDPIQPRTKMERAWINGKEVSLRSRQVDLFERFRNLW